MSKTWWQGGCIYQIYPRSFYDSNNDGVGDLQGIIDKLDYVAELGVDGIWISPFFTSPMVDFGYDVADYKDVDPIFGDIEDFKRLVDKAHRLGLKVIIDQVYSHSSNKNPWFEESRQNNQNGKADWYVWADPKEDGTPPNNWQSIFGGTSWQWDNVRKQYYLHNFLPEQPDLNLHNPQVQEALFDVAKFWLDLGVDGFRLDAINYGMHNRALTDNPPFKVTDPHLYRPYHMQHHIHNLSQPGMPRFLSKLKDVLNEYGAIFTVAEIGGGDPIPLMKEYTFKDERLSTAYSFEFLSAGDLTKHTIIQALSNWSNDKDDSWPSWAFSNHDAPRVASRWASQAHIQYRAKLYLLLLMSIRGTVFLYQGEELGLSQSDVPFDQLQDPEAINNWPDNLGRDGSRTPMPWLEKATYQGFSTVEPWLPMEADHQALSVDKQMKDANSTLNFSKALLAFRKQHPELITGDLTLVDEGDNESALLVFKRNIGENELLCVFNLTDEDVTIELSKGVLWRQSVVFSIDEQQSQALAKGIVKANSGFIFRGAQSA